MKYGKLNLGQIEAIVNKLGGMEGVQKFLSGELILAKLATPTLTFIYDQTKDGWKLLENVVRTTEIDIKKFELVSFIRGGESYINSEEMVRRAKELKANLGQQHAEYLLTNQDQIPQEFRKHYLVFPGTVWLDKNGCRSVPYLRWYGAWWNLRFLRLSSDWIYDDRLLRERKPTSTFWEV